MKKIILLFSFLNLFNFAFCQKRINEIVRFKSETIDMGKIEQNHPTTATFEITNTGKSEIIIEQANPTCGCVISEYTEEPISPGSVGFIKATYNAKNINQFEKHLSVKFAGIDEIISLTIKGEVIYTNAQISDAEKKPEQSKNDDNLVKNISQTSSTTKTQSEPTANNNIDDKSVTLTVIGQGKTIEEAKTNALRSAIEQAFGTFVSSNTTILNDSLVKDEIVSVTNGNIQKYDVLNEIALPNGSYLTTLKAIVSVSKLTSYCESKGVKVEFEGGLFSYNIKLQILNEESEIKAIKELTQSVFRILQQSFDYSVKMRPPLSLDNENKKWKISLSITATTNNNINLLSEMLFKTLSSISLKSISEYSSIGKSVYPIYFYYKGEKKAFYLRKEQSLKIFESLFNNKVWMYCLSSFQINNGFEKQQRVGIAEPKMWLYHYECSFDEMYNDAPSKGLRGQMINPGDAHSIGTCMAYLFQRDKTYRVFLLEPSRVAAIFSFDDVKDISEIEKIKEYVVAPLDIKISDYDGISN